MMSLKRGKTIFASFENITLFMDALSHRVFGATDRMEVQA